MGDTAIGVPIREPSRHVLFVDASSTGIAGRKTSFGTRTTSPLSFILRRWVSWRLPRRDSHPRSPRTEPSVATRPEVLVFHPIRPLTWPFHRSYQTSRPRFSARTRSLLPRKRKSTATNLPPSISFVDFWWNISRSGSTSVCSWNEISFICEFSRREIETSDFSQWNFVTGRFFLWRDRYVDLNLLRREGEDLILRIFDIVRIFNLCSLELIFFLFIVCWIQWFCEWFSI